MVIRQRCTTGLRKPWEALSHSSSGLTCPVAEVRLERPVHVAYTLMHVVPADHSPLCAARRPVVARALYEPRRYLGGTSRHEQAHNALQSNQFECYVNN